VVATFTTQGIQVGQEAPFPLCLLVIQGEKTVGIGMQIYFAFKIMAKVRGLLVMEISKEFDLHMTDSLEYNKGIGILLQMIYNLDEPAGQIFCGSYTSLGFAGVLNKVVASIERDMTLEQIV